MFKTFLVTLSITAGLFFAGMAAQNASAAEAKAQQSVTVQGFQFSGNTVVSSNTLAGIVAPNQGKELSLAELQAIADSISTYYRGQGYFLAVTVLPEQDIANGVVNLQILEGRLGKVVINGNVRYSTRFLQAYFNHMRHEGVIRQRDMDRALLLMNTLPGMTVTSVLQAGEEKGTTDIVVTVKEDQQTRGNLEVDNYGSQYSRIRTRGGVDFINPAHHGDTFSLSGVTGVSSTKLYYFNGNYSIPVDANGTAIGFYGLSGDFGIGKEFAVLDIQGRATAFGISVTRTIKINRQSNTIAELGLDAKNSKQDILNINASNDRIRSLRLGVKRSSEGPTGRFFASFNVEQGLGDMLGSMENDAPNSSRAAAGADNNFTKFNFEIARVKNLGPKAFIIARGSGQIAMNSLVVGEQMAIGGVDSVRGYQQAEYIGDNGFQASVEARFALTEKQMSKFQFAAFLDGGHITVKETVQGQASSASLTGAGLGFRIFPGKDFLIRADVGFPIGREPSDGKSVIAYLQAVKNF